MKKKMAKTLAVLMCLMTAVAFMPTFAFAAEGTDITVYLTVSDQGKIAKANDGSAVAWKEVKVSDKDGDGHYSVDEALIAAHGLYNSAEGYATSSGYVEKLWGKKTSNCWFAVNGKGLATGVSQDEVEDGDYLTASINKDDVLYADWYAEFDKKNVKITEGEKVELKLSGFQGSTSYKDSELKNIKDAGVGVWNDGSFEKKASSDESGKASISFDKAGTYVITAEGSVNGTVDATVTWTLMETTRDKDEKTVYGKTDWSTYESFVGYTESEYGEGPYPWSEIKWEALEDFDADEWDYDTKHLLYSGDVEWDCPIMAPASVVTVEHGELAHEKVAAGNLKNGCEYDECTVCKSKLNYKTVPGWSTNYVKSFKVSKGKKCFTAKWKKQSKKNRKKFNGYQLRYSKNRNMAGAAYMNVSKSSKSKKVKKLARKASYYVQVRSYTDSKGVRYYAGWSSVKAVKTR